MATRPGQLYEGDFYAWRCDQAKALRRLKATRPTVELDLDHLIEEVEATGRPAGRGGSRDTNRR